MEKRPEFGGSIHDGLPSRRHRRNGGQLCQCRGRAVMPWSNWPYCEQKDVGQGFGWKAVDGGVVDHKSHTAQKLSSELHEYVIDLNIHGSFCLLP